MSIFKKRNTLTENITYMALMAAINIIFVLTSTLIPVLLFLLVFLLPLTSSIVTVFCKKRYYPIYALATIGLCLIVTLWDIGDTFYYVIPSIITGFIFGILYNKNIPITIKVLITTFVQVLLTYGCIAFFQLITGRNFLDDMVTVIGLSDYKYLAYVKNIFIYAIALIQEIFSYIVIKEELPKFEPDVETNNDTIFNSIAILGLSLLTLLFAFLIPEITYTFMLSAMLIGLNEFIHICLSKNKILIIVSIIFVFVTFFIFSITYTKFNAPLGLLLLGLMPLVISIIVLLNKCFIKQNKKV